MVTGTINYDDKKARKEFENFKKISNEVNDYKDYEILTPEVLVRLFYVKTKTKSGVLVNTDLSAASTDYQITILPFVKVLCVGKTVSEDWKEHLEVGSIYSIKDNLVATRKNPQWEAWYKNHKDERPQTVPEPPTHVCPLTDGAKYCFLGDKFKAEITEDDAFTMLIPISFIQAKYNG